CHPWCCSRWWKTRSSTAAASTGGRASRFAPAAPANACASRCRTAARARRPGRPKGSASPIRARGSSSSTARAAVWISKRLPAEARLRWWRFRCARPLMAETVRAAVVEDEPPARLGLRALLAREPSIVLVHECADLPHALRALRREPVDLLFLDVQLAGQNGFDLLSALGPARPPAVVFVTAYDHHAVRAFDVEAVDYLLKPFDDQRFAQALGRAMERLRLHGAQKLARQLADSLAPGAPPAPEGRTVTLRDGARTTFLREDEIDWIEAQDYYVEIHAGGNAHLHRETLRELEARL